MTRALGIDLGSHSIKIAEFEFTPKRRHLMGLYEINRTPELSAFQNIRDFFATNGTRSERMATGLGPTLTLLRTLRFPFADKRRVNLAVQGDFEDNLPFNLSDYILDFKATGRRIDKLHEFITGVCPINQLTQLNEGFESINILPNAYFVDAEALGQLALHQDLPAAANDGVYAVCDFGEKITKLALLRGSRPRVFNPRLKTLQPEGALLEMRTLTRGTSDLLRYIEQRRNLTDFEARQWLEHRAEIKVAVARAEDELPSDDVSDEIKQGLRPVIVEIYQTFQAFRGHTGLNPQTLYITGGVTGIRGLREFLSIELRTEVEQWPIDVGFNTSEIPLSPEQNRRFAVAIALAHRYAIAKPKGWLNFRRSAQAQKKLLTHAIEVFNRPEIREVLIGLGIFVAFLFAYSAINSFFLGQQINVVQKSLTDEFRRFDSSIKTKGLLNNAKRTAELFQDKRKAKELLKAQQEKDTSQHYRARSEFLLDLAQALPLSSVLKQARVDGFKMDAVYEFANPLANPDFDRQKQALNTFFAGRGYGDVSVDRLANDMRVLSVKARWKESDK